MFRMRRYRIFLLVAVLAAASVYYFVDIRHTSLSDVDRLRQYTFGANPHKQQSNGGQPHLPTEHQADTPPKLKERPPPDPENGLPAVLLTTSRRAAHPTLDDFFGPTTTSTAIDEAETTTGEELLLDQYDSDEDLKLITGNDRDAQRVLGGPPQPTWQPQKEHNPVSKDKLIRLPEGKVKVLPQIQYAFVPETNPEKADRLRKLVAIREAFKHAWQGYKTYAMPHDELLPLSKTSSDSFMGWGATLVDSLDTLWIMDLKEDFEEAVNETRKINFKTSYKKEIPMFETVIRLLGGLISAHDLSDGQYPVLLDKAIELADILMGAFDTPNRMPDMYYRWAPSYASQQHRAGTNVVLAEMGSMSMEFTRLAQLTGENKYYDAVARVQNELEEWQMKTEIPGLWPLRLDASGCRKSDKVKAPSHSPENREKPVLLGSEHINAEDLMTGETPANLGRKRAKRQVDDITSPVEPESDHRADKVDAKMKADERGDAQCTPQGLNYEPYAKIHRYSINAQADSLYEYMPKMHRLLGGLSSQYESMYFKATKPIREKVIFRAMIKDSKRKVLFPAEYVFNLGLKVKAKRVKVNYEMTHLGCFAGGMFGLGSKTFDVVSDMELAKQLTDGCIWAYESTSTKVMPEKAFVVPCENLQSCPWSEAQWHKALDPKLRERVDAVDAWNKEQKKLYKQTGINVAKEAKRVEPPPKPQATVFKGAVVKAAELKKADALLKRDPPMHDTPSPSLDSDEDGTTLEQFGFVPKVAMSHEGYVKARISEERLPPGYTSIADRSYILRPEAIESVFLMWRMTGEEYWRQKGWNMFQAVQEATHVAAGNAGLIDVTSILGDKMDKMESFWLGETLKYCYLLFSEPDLVNLDDYVFNTEAHPFKVPKPVQG